MATELPPNLSLHLEKVAELFDEKFQSIHVKLHVAKSVEIFPRLKVAHGVITWLNKPPA